MGGLRHMAYACKLRNEWRRNSQNRKCKECDNCDKNVLTIGLTNIIYKVNRKFS